MSTPRPSLQDWIQKLENDLKGRTADQPAWRTADGFSVPALATSDDLRDLPHLAARGLLTGRRGWRIRELCNDSDPRDANRRARAALAAGADEVEFFFDALVQDALDPDQPDEAGDADDPLSIPAAPGDGGVAVHSRADFDLLLDGLDSASAPLWFSAGEGATAIGAWWLRHAAERGVAADRLRGGLDLDPLARLSMRRIARHGDDAIVARRSSADSVFDEAAAWIRSCADTAPGLRPMVLDGQVHHLGGAAPGLELGATLAGIVDVARHLGARGVSFEQLTRAATIRVQVGHELLPELAKLRALRLAFARIARLCGAAPEGLVPQVLGVTSSRQRAEDFDQRTNLLRTTLACFAAVAGGCDSVVVMPYDDTAPDEAAWTLARNQQLLLRDEGHLGRVADPFGGSFAVERLTHEIGRAGWEVFLAIERQGGLIETMRNGWLNDRLQRHEEARENAFRYRKRVLVGISRFADLELGGPAPGSPPGDADDVGEDVAAAARTARFVAWRASRGPVPTDWLASLARPDADLLTKLGAGDADRASVAEIATASWPDEGTDVVLRFLPLAGTDGHEFEELRLWTEATRDAGEELPRVLLLPVGPLRWARARADFARDLFLVGGLPVDDPGHFTNWEAARAKVLEAGAAVIVLCSDDASYPELAAGTREAMAELDDPPVLVVAGKVDGDLSALVDGAVHLGMDVIAFLRELQEDLGVRAEAES